MARKKANTNTSAAKSRSSTASSAGQTVGKQRQAQRPADYRRVLGELTQLIADSRRRAAATVNRELVLLYWQIGAVIVHQQETAKWGDAVVEQLAADLRAEFPDMKGLMRSNLFRMRQFHRAWLEIDHWLVAGDSETAELSKSAIENKKVATLSQQFDLPETQAEIVATLWRQFRSSGLPNLILAVSWSHHREVIGACDTPAERYFYLSMAVRERWSVRELRRQIDSDLFTRYVSVRDQPEKCLPEEAESGDLLPFKDHYVLEFLGLQEQHSEQQLRRAILSNLREFFLEFGRDLTFVGEEYPLTVGNDTFFIDLLFFHRRLQCLIAVDLKKGKFKPEYVGKTQFYCAALDEQIKLAHEKPSIGLVLCKSADRVQVRLALTAAAEQVGVATYQTALPDERLIRERLKSVTENFR